MICPNTNLGLKMLQLHFSCRSFSLLKPMAFHRSYAFSASRLSSTEQYLLVKNKVN
jgi:hypothetical protein